MAPERYHSNVLELLTPPRTPCARLRRGRPAPRSLTGTVVREAAGGPAISAPGPPRFRGEGRGSGGSGAGGSGPRAVPRARTPEGTTRTRARRLRKGPSARRRFQRIVRCRRSRRPRSRLAGTEAPTGVPWAARARGARDGAARVGALGGRKLLGLFVLFDSKICPRGLWRLLRVLAPEGCLARAACWDTPLPY